MTQCQQCSQSFCCTNITIPLGNRATVDLLKFYVAHKNVDVVKQGPNWAVIFRTECEHLLPEGLCGIYEERYDLCRQYSTNRCEFVVPDDQRYDRVFTNVKQLIDFLNKEKTQC